MSSDLGTIGDLTHGALQLQDHNGRLEVIPTGAFDYAMLEPYQVAKLIATMAKWLAEVVK